MEHHFKATRCASEIQPRLYSQYMYIVYIVYCIMYTLYIVYCVLVSRIDTPVIITHSEAQLYEDVLHVLLVQAALVSVETLEKVG